MLSGILGDLGQLAAAAGNNTTEQGSQRDLMPGDIAAGLTRKPFVSRHHVWHDSVAGCHSSSQPPRGMSVSQKPDRPHRFAVRFQHGNENTLSDSPERCFMEILEPFVPSAKAGGRPETYPKREILNGTAIPGQNKSREMGRFSCPSAGMRPEW